MLGSQWALSPKTNDVFAENGRIARVSGLASLPQILKSNLSLRRGESPFNPDYGANFATYFDEFRDTPWLTRFLKLESARLASIPYYRSQTMRGPFTPFQCVERVWGIEILKDSPDGHWLPVRLDLEVGGVGRWQCDIDVHVNTARPA